jgi:hypothetical protein
MKNPVSFPESFRRYEDYNTGSIWTFGVMTERFGWTAQFGRTASLKQAEDPCG